MTQPVIFSTWSFGQRGNVAAWPALAAGGSSLDAVETVCTVIEDDPEVDSVGFGGLPDASGNITLDAAVMLGPSRCGSVCGVSRHLHVTSIARAVMERTPHVLLVGDNADAFADEQGFDESPLLADHARDQWHHWLERRDEIDQSRDKGYELRPQDVRGSGRLFHQHETHSDASHAHDTIGAIAQDLTGDIAVACSSSGLPYKLPGRVGDSPIIGHGLYVDPAVGAVVATGTGELIMGVCGSFLAIELMRYGATPLDAITEVLRRIEQQYTLSPVHQVALIALHRDGLSAAAALRPGFRYVMTAAGGTSVREPDMVFIAES